MNTQRVTLTAQGHLFTARFFTASPVPGTGIRGTIKGFSAGSRKRMLDQLARLNIRQRKGHSYVATAITLTTRAILTPQEATINFNNFWKRLQRRWPTASCIWRKEFQERGSPHFHLIVFGMGYWQKEQLQAAWGEIVNEDRPFTRIESIRSWRGALSYVAKYMAKIDDRERAAGVAVGDDLSGFNYVTYLTAVEETGRIWGIRNRKHLPEAVLRVWTAHLGPWWREIKRAGRAMWDGVDLDTLYGFTLYLEDADEFLRFALQKVPDGVGQLLGPGTNEAQRRSANGREAMKIP